jgi:hypothetical protein
MRGRKRRFSALIAAVVLLAQTQSPSGNIKGITVAPIEDRRLGPVGYGSAPCEEALGEIAELGADWVSLTPFGRMDDLDSTDVLLDFEIPVDENERMIKKAAAQARALGLKVAIIPHIYVMSGRWRGEIDPGSDDRLEEWFLSYERFMTRWAALAEELRADLFSIGVEFKSTTNSHGKRWRRTIDLARSIYSGPLTYSANWDEVEYVEFWDALDFIGINAFWPLASRPGDGFEKMCGRAQEVARELAGMAFYWDRRVVFVEFGVKSATDSVLAPWEWPEHCDGLTYDEDYQAAAFQAVFEAMTRSWWFEGLFVWKYFSDPFDVTQEDRTGFSPREKRAESVLREWFAVSWEDASPHFKPGVRTCTGPPWKKYF